MNLYTHIRGITIEIDIEIHIAVMWVVHYFYSIFEKRNRILLGKCFCYFTTRPRQRLYCKCFYDLLVFILFFAAFPVFRGFVSFSSPFCLSFSSFCPFLSYLSCASLLNNHFYAFDCIDSYPTKMVDKNESITHFYLQYFITIVVGVFILSN